MNEPIKIIKAQPKDIKKHRADKKPYLIKIYYDDDPMNPREDYDYLGTIVHWHRNYDLGDKIDTHPDEYEKKLIKEGSVYLPVYIYDHSGITINTTGFSCPWDSGQVGYIYVTKEDLDNGYGEGRWTEEKIKEYLKVEIAEFDQYLRGEIYGYVLENPEGEEVDSCWGMYDIESIENEALYSLDLVKEVVDND